MLLARDEGAADCLFTRHGNDFTARFPLAVAAVTALPAWSFLVDGEAIVTDASGLAVFDLIRRKRHGDQAVRCVFDLIELDGEDLRRSPIEHRKRTLATTASTLRTKSSAWVPQPQYPQVNAVIRFKLPAPE